MSAAKRTPPSPPGSFLLGNMLQILRDPLDFAADFARAHGDVVRFRLGPLVVHLVSHPEAIEQILRRDHRLFIKDRGTRMLSQVLGEGLLTSEGETWRRQRRLAQPSFQGDQLQKYAPGMTAAAQHLLESWQPGETRDIHADMTRLTMEIAAQAFLGTSVTDKADRVGRAMQTVIEYFANMLILIPGYSWLPVPRNFRYRRACRELDAVIYETIAQRRAERRTDGDDLLSRLLSAHDEDGSQMTDKQLRDELVTLFLAGHETTAIALSFCFYLMALHPEVESKLHAEVDEVLQGEPADWSDLARLRYTDWVVKETMRLYPPVPSIGRQSTSDYEVMGYHIPKGSQVSFAQWVVHRDARWYADPLEFRPERWDNDLIRKLPRCAYFPFGEGPRICIGNLFAGMEAVLILATVAQRYRLATVPGFKLDILPSITLRPRHGLPMIVSERTRAAATGPVGQIPVKIGQ
jgi:cytochrome P450